jgi:hypothetical protein
MYGEDLQAIYLEPDDARYHLLFEQVVRLLTKPSPFNHALPRPFVTVAHRYLDGQPETVRHLTDPDNRNFMMSDLYDVVQLMN